MVTSWAELNCDTSRLVELAPGDTNVGSRLTYRNLAAYEETMTGKTVSVADTYDKHIHRARTPAARALSQWDRPRCNAGAGRICV